MIINFPNKDSCHIILSKFINNITQNKQVYLVPNKNIKKSIINVYDNEKNYNFLIKCIKYSSDILTNNNDSFILSIFCNKNNSLKWNICIYSNIMFNLPFTLDNIIFIPYNYLNTSRKNNNYATFSNTLIHEKIHVFQRFNLDLWNNIISLSFKDWIIIYPSNELFNFLINYKFNELCSIVRIFNPDVFYDFLYIYKYNNGYYYGILHLINNKIKTKWYLIKQLNLIDVPDSFSINYLPTEEHPFEMFAYKFSNHLCH